MNDASAEQIRILETTFRIPLSRLPKSEITFNPGAPLTADCGAILLISQEQQPETRCE
jgi:hypothetical protein